MCETDFDLVCYGSSRPFDLDLYSAATTTESHPLQNVKVDKFREFFIFIYLRLLYIFFILASDRP